MLGRLTVRDETPPRKLHIGQRVLVRIPLTEEDAGTIVEGPMFRMGRVAFKVRYDDGFRNWYPVIWLAPAIRLV